jgi:hypothetical protein
MNDYKSFPPTNQISIDSIVQYRCAFGSIPHPTKTLNETIAVLDNIILNFAKGLNFQQGPKS